MPTWDQTMLPIMKELSDGGVKDAVHLRSVVIAAFDMTVAEQNEVLKSGQTRIFNRVSWGLSNLRKTKLIKNGPKRGTYVIADAGKELLAAHNNGFLLEQLKTVPAFQEWKKDYQAKKKNNDTGNVSTAWAMCKTLVSMKKPRRKIRWRRPPNS